MTRPRERRSSQSIRRPLISCLFVIFPAICAIAQTTSLEPITIAAGSQIDRELNGGEAQLFSIKLSSGQFLHVKVEQNGIDVTLELLKPNGDSMVVSDAPNGRYGPEEIAVIAEDSGDYQLKVLSPRKSEPAGGFKATVVNLRTPTQTDRDRTAAESAWVEAYMKLLKLRTADSRRLAIEKCRTALTFFQSSGEEYRQGWILHTITLLHAQSGEFRQAFEVATGTLPLFRSVGDSHGISSTLNFLGGMSDVLGEPQRALEYYHEALPATRAGHVDQLMEGTVLNNIGKIYNDLAEWQKSIEYYNQALPLLRSRGIARSEGNTLHNIGVAHVGLGESERSLDMFQQALVLRRTAKDPAGEADTLTSIGYVLNSLGRSQEALEVYTQAMPLRTSVGDRRGEGITLDHIGIVYASLGQPGRALEYHQKGLERHRTAESPRTEAVALGNIGHVHNLLKQPEKAVEFYTEALAIFNRIGDRQNEAKMYEGLANAERNLGNFSGALKHIDAALTLIESVRSAAGAQQSRSAYLASRHAAYELNIDLLMHLHQQNPTAGYDSKALQASERARARSLIEMLGEARVDFRQGVNPVLIARELELGRRLNAKAQRQIQIRTQKSGSKEEIGNLEREVATLEGEYQQVQAAIRKNSPAYASITQPRPLTVKEIQKQLDSDTVLLEYSLGETRSFVWAVTPTSFKSYELPPRSAIDKNARKVFELLSARSIAKPGENPIARQARHAQLDSVLFETTSELGRQVLKPLANELGNKRLLIVADGSLQYVPFAALPAVPSDQKQKTGLSAARLGAAAYRPLILDHEIVTAPSATAIAVQRKNLAGRKPADKTVVVIADPVFSETDDRVAGSGSTDGPPRTTDIASTRILEHNAGGDAWTSSIRRLRFTRQEADQILAVAPRDSSLKALDFDANRNAGIAVNLSQYRYVHFATHGYLDTQRPGLSALVLSLVDRQGKPQDGFLRAHDIYNLNLPAELVVLSACQTGLGKEIKGEGLVGLTQGFMYAGARRVVVSLWNVNDKATAQLMQRFYRGMLRESLPPAAALRTAQVEMWKQKRWQSPYYWAAFTLQGEWQ